MGDADPNTTWVPDACALPTVEQPLRVAEFDTLFRSALRAVQRIEPTRVRLVLDAEGEATARDLARRETECCSFFTFDVTPADDGQLHVDVAVPDDRREVLDALVSRATGLVSGQGR